MQMTPDVLFSIVGFPVTNTVVATLVTDVVIVALVVIVGKSITVNPCGIQNAVEIVVDYFSGITASIAGERAAFICPWVVSFFLFIAVSNLLAQLPGFETIRFCSACHSEGVPFLKSATSDLNLTLAVAVASVIITHYLSIKYTGIRAYFTRFVTFKMFPIFLFVGLLELLNELTKFISFSFRLFGNIFAGEKVVAVMYNLCSLGLPLPFIALEMLVAVIQAMVFSVLTMVFMNIMTDKSH